MGKCGGGAEATVVARQLFSTRAHCTVSSGLRGHRRHLCLSACWPKLFHAQSARRSGQRSPPCGFCRASEAAPLGRSLCGLQAWRSAGLQLPPVSLVSP